MIWQVNNYSFVIVVHVHHLHQKNKKCGNRSYRTEKRQLQLSPNNQEKTSIPCTTTWRNLRFYQIRKIVVRQKEYKYPLGQIYLLF